MMLNFRAKKKLNILIGNSRNKFIDVKTYLLIKLLNSFNASPKRILEFINKESGRVIVWVPTASIKYFLPNKNLEIYFAPNEVGKSFIPSFFLQDNWDVGKHLIDDSYKTYSRSYRSMFQIFVEGRNYYECDEYQHLASKIKKTGSSPRGNSIEELNNYFLNLLKLKKKLETEGYKIQKQLSGKKYDEIGVFIDRFGNLIKPEDNFSGTHRFAIAKIINLKKIPVCVLAVHKKWGISNINLLGELNRKKLEKYYSNRKTI